MRWIGILWTNPAECLLALMVVAFVVCLIWRPGPIIRSFRNIGLAIKALLGVFDEGEGSRGSAGDRWGSSSGRSCGSQGRRGYRSEFGRRYGKR